MSEKKDFEMLRSALVEVLCIDADAVTRTARIRDDLGADSLDMMEIGFEIEDAFEVYFDFATLGALIDCATVAEVLAVVKKARGGR